MSIALGDLKELASALKEKTGLNLQPALSRLEQAQTCVGSILEL